MTIEDFALAVARERLDAALETRARAARFLAALGAGKAPRDPDDVPRAQRMLADAERTLANPGAGWTIELCAAVGEIRLVVGDA